MTAAFVQARAFFAPALSFIRAAADAGAGVLIHCFAGAHRAGTTGVAFLMEAEGLSAADATAAAQRLRPVIDPQVAPRVSAISFSRAPPSLPPLLNRTQRVAGLR